ncbi:MAG: hypothetical protein EP330_00640 [Deltaproteobacteria bacterium]|nr:MAG: hypothetical protein EP330_00640 [Deltaproteobacteria bacterium]
MHVLLLATLALADIAPPPGTRTPTCDASACPEGTPETAWCTTKLGQLPECPETAGWERGCMKKAGLYAEHLMCKPTEAKAPVAETTPAASPEEGWSSPCSTSPGQASLALAIAGLLLVRRRRRV